MEKVQQQLYPPSSIGKMSQEDIEEILTTITASLSPEIYGFPSPGIRGHGQPAREPPPICCFHYGDCGHKAMSCPIKPSMPAKLPASTTIATSTTPHADVIAYIR